MRAIALIHDFTNSFFFRGVNVFFLFIHFFRFAGLFRRFDLNELCMWNAASNTRVKWTKWTLEFDENVIWKWKTWWDEIYVWISVNNGQQQLNHTKHLLYYPQKIPFFSSSPAYLFKSTFRPYSLKRQRIGEKKWFNHRRDVSKRVTRSIQMATK